MFVINAIAAIVSMFIGLLIYKYIDIKKPPVNWGSAIAAGKYYSALKACKSLQTAKKHIKNYRYLCDEILPVKAQYLCIVLDLADVRRKLTRGIHRQPHHQTQQHVTRRSTH